MFCCRWNPIGQPVWIGLSDLPLLFTCQEIEDSYHLWRVGMPSLWWARARHSAMGLAMAERLVSSLVEAGWSVLSDLAEAIYAAVHRGCLTTCGAPVAVLGMPLNRTYPGHLVILQRAIGAQGVLLSELRSCQRVL